MYLFVDKKCQERSLSLTCVLQWGSKLSKANCSFHKRWCKLMKPRQHSKRESSDELPWLHSLMCRPHCMFPCLLSYFTFVPTPINYTRTHRLSATRLPKIHKAICLFHVKMNGAVRFQLSPINILWLMAFHLFFSPASWSKTRQY